MEKMTRENWIAVTAVVGSWLVMNGKVQEGMAIVAISQRVSDSDWNNACENSEGLMKPKT